MLLQTATNTTWWFLGLFISVWNDSTWGCVVFWFTYISLSFWVEMLEACLVDEIHLMSEQETDGRLDSRKKKKENKTKQKTHQHTRFPGLCRLSKCWCSCSQPHLELWQERLLFSGLSKWEKKRDSFCTCMNFRSFRFPLLFKLCFSQAWNQHKMMMMKLCVFIGLSTYLFT